MATSEQAQTLGRLVGDLGGRYMTDGAGFARASEIGLDPGLCVYVVGRFGVLGNVDADVVSAAAGFWNPDTIRSAWEGAVATVEPRVAAAWYSDVCATYGRTHLGDADGLERVAELAERVVDTAPVRGAPLFAGWRAVARVDDAPGAAYQLVHLLRELRFGLHVAASVTAGIDPVVAMQLTPGAAPMIGAFGWSEPWPEPSDEDRTTRARIEAHTDARAAAALSVLDDAEVDELTELIGALAER